MTKELAELLNSLLEDIVDATGAVQDGQLKEVHQILASMEEQIIAFGYDKETESFLPDNFK